jgi:hypothetical protein
MEILCLRFGTTKRPFLFPNVSGGRSRNSKQRERAANEISR